MVEYKEPKLREKLLKVYSRFIEDPSDKTNLKEIEKLDNRYGSLEAINDYLKSRPIPKEIANATGYLSNLWLNSFDFDKKEIESEAKKILEDLRKT
ncbi:hypothetical protein J4459_03135 [Candidatus Woesearchaeota archaeon]|nr:hypothetical protein [Candidatus Woesearchaeota archaeon]